MWAGLLTDRINNKLKKSNLINAHALDREPGLAMPFFIFGDSRLFYWLAAFILIGHILLWLHSLLLQFNRTDVCLLSMTVCICWHWLYFFFVPWWIFWVSNPIRPPLFGCVLNVLCYSFTGHWCRFLATWFAIWFSVRLGYSSTLCLGGLATLEITLPIVKKKNNQKI